MSVTGSSREYSGGNCVHTYLKTLARTEASVVALEKCCTQSRNESNNALHDAMYL